MSAQAGAGAEERALLRSEVALAGRILAPSWPLSSFIAVNPLGGLEHLPFEEAIALGSEVLGARGTLAEHLFRQAHAEGRVSDGDLSAALAERYPEAFQSAAVRLGEREHPAEEILLRDLLHGDPAPEPVRAVRTRAERTAPRLADAIDAQSTKWCAAFCDDMTAGWKMPGRERGFYAAWRDLAPRDRAMGRSTRAKLRSLLAAQAETTALLALDELGVPAAQRRSYLQAHLACLPGWASHVRWRESIAETSTWSATSRCGSPTRRRFCGGNPGSAGTSPSTASSRRPRPPPRHSGPGGWPT